MNSGSVQRYMFYIYLALGFALFGAGVYLIPGWFKLLWIAGCLAFATALPTALARLSDPLNARRITRHLAATGATDIEVKPFPNHYAARFNRDGRRHSARCSVKRGKVTVNERESVERRA